MSVEQHSLEWNELAALYALGALEDEELRAFEAHQRGCDRCVETVAQDRETLRHLSLAAPEVDASPGFKEKLLARARDELAEEAAPVSVAPEPLRFRPRRNAWYVPLAAVLVAAVVTTAGLAMVAQQGYGQQVVASINLEKRQPVEGSAAVLVHRSGDSELRLDGMSDPPAGHVYQAWVIAPDSAPVASGTLSDGQGSLPLGQGLAGKTVAVTVEPSPGASAPSQQPFLVARVTG